MSPYSIALDLLISTGMSTARMHQTKKAFRPSNTNAADLRNRPGNPCFEPQNGILPVSLFYSKADA